MICDEQVWCAQWSGQGQRLLPIQVSCAWVRSLVPSRTYVAGISELVVFCPHLVLSVLQLLFLGYKHRVLVIGTRAPNAMPIIPTCLREIARKITFASKRLAVSQLQLLCSVLCSCMMCFVFIINYSLIEFISFSYFLFL